MNRRNRIASDIETNENFQAGERIQQTLTNSKDSRKSSRRSSRARSMRGQANEVWALYKSNPSRVSWGDLSTNRYG